MSEIKLTDEPGFVCQARAIMWQVLKAMDKGMEVDTSKTLDELMSECFSYLQKHWETEVFAKCQITEIDKKKNTASYKWEDGFGCEFQGIAIEYEADERAIEVEPGEWIYVKKGDKRFAGAHRLVTKNIDSVGRLVQLYC